MMKEILIIAEFGNNGDRRKSYPLSYDIIRSSLKTVNLVMNGIPLGVSCTLFISMKLLNLNSKFLKIGLLGYSFISTVIYLVYSFYGRKLLRSMET